ncbi:STAS domain-containing protein [bacterium]|nr:STAS domain-containing protein [bacterium]
MVEQKLEVSQSGDVTIYRLGGYFEDTAGKALKEVCKKGLSEGKILYVFDFKGVPVVNSPGLSAILDLVVQVIDYNDGKVAISGLNNLTRNALRMTGVLALCKEFPAEAEAIQSISG